MRQLEQGLKNMQKIVESVPMMIFDHHALRDESWQQRISGVYKQASKSGHSITTAAEYSGNENLFLELKRKNYIVTIRHPQSLRNG